MGIPVLLTDFLFLYWVSVFFFSYSFFLFFIFQVKATILLGLVFVLVVQEDDLLAACGGKKTKTPTPKWSSCGLERLPIGADWFADAECDTHTNRSFGCHENFCWRSNPTSPGQWCFPTKSVPSAKGVYRRGCLKNDECLKIAKLNYGDKYNGGKIRGCADYKSGRA